MEKELFEQLRKNILYYLPEIKHVALWNNQFIRSNGTNTDGRKQMQFNYPAVFIQFSDSTFRQLSLGVQEFEIEVTLHLGYKSLETEDLTILWLKEQLYWVVQRFQEGSFARMSRVKEEWDYDHDNVTVLKMQFHTYGKDYFRYVFGQNTQDTITGITETTILVPSISGGTDYSDASYSNGNNTYPPTSNN